jgi:hemoglobin-like flavoprotein
MQATLLRESLDRIFQQKEDFATTFYQSLLENYPQLQPLFANVDVRRQQTSLIATLTVLVKGIEQNEDLTPLFRKLGSLHNTRRIRAEHYPPFGATLLDTMTHFDPEWTSAHREAWTTAIDLCVRGMMQSYDPGARQYRIQVNTIRNRNIQIHV